MPAIPFARQPQARHRDLTVGSVRRLVLTLAVPSTLESALMSVVNLLHAYWMGRVGGLALAAVMMGNSLRIVLISPMMGLSMGGMALVARHIGARESRQADHAVMQVALLITFFVSLSALIGLTLGGTFLRWMGAQGDVWHNALAYSRIVFYGLFFMEMFPSLSGVIRGAGRPEYTLRINLVNAVAMMVLEPILVLGWGPIPALGVRGAALSSVLASASGVAAQFYILLTGKAGVRLHWKDIVPDFRVMWRILRIALPVSIQRLSPNLGNAVFLRLVSSLGETVLAAYSIVSQFGMFLQALPMGLGSAAATMTGQNLGAHAPERAERAAHFGTRMAALSSAVITFLIALFARPVLGLFTRDAAVIAVGVVAVWCNILALSARAWLLAMSSILAGAGDTISPMLIYIGNLWLAQLPLCWLLSNAAGLGALGIWLGIALGEMISATAITRIFASGRWKTRRV